MLNYYYHNFVNFIKVHDVPQYNILIQITTTYGHRYHTIDTNDLPIAVTEA